MRLPISGLAFLPASLLALSAWAAGGPYTVDDSEIGDPGDCKIETWGSRSDNGDHLGVASPSCVFTTLPFFELGFDAQRGRIAGSYETLIVPKVKASLVPIERFGVGIGVMAGAAYSTLLGGAAGALAFVPFTIQPIEEIRINVNLGWAWDRAAHRNFATAGVGAEWQIHPQLAVIGEAYGQDAGRWAKQIGLRPTVIDKVLDLDLIYGRGIDGKRSNWITFGGVLRF